MCSDSFSKPDRLEGLHGSFQKSAHRSTSADNMNNEILSKYNYLWNGSSPGWVLLKAPDLPGGFCVFHKVNQTLLHIESANINEAVCKRMKESGCEIIEKLPPSTVALRPRPLK
jgi:hypothetical protein